MSNYVNNANYAVMQVHGDISGWWL